MVQLAGEQETEREGARRLKNGLIGWRERGEDARGREGGRQEA